MLYENIKKVLDKAKEKGVDILVARDMVINADKIKEDEYMVASKVIQTYYKFITGCRVAGNEEDVKTLCELYENGDIEKIRELIED